MAESTLSISVRLRRVRTETAHVSVPITDALTRPDDEGQGRKLDVDKIIEAALQLGHDETIAWEPEQAPEIRLHPVQAASEQDSIQ